MGHPNRKSVSFALFSAFLDQLEAAHTADIPSGVPPEEQRRLLRAALLHLAVQRVNEEWDRVARRGRRTPCVLRQSSLGAFLVVNQQGELREPFRLEREDLLKHVQRLSRGLTDLVGVLE